MMEAVRNSETSVTFNVTTRRYILEDSKLHTRRRENLKSHTVIELVTRYRMGTVSNIVGILGFLQTTGTW
jgi:hypothetical protein